MVLLTNCCFGRRSLRTRTYAAAIFIMFMYLCFLVTACLNLKYAADRPSDLLTLSTLAVMSSGMCISTSIMLILGMCTDTKVFFIPWLIVVPLSTILEIIFSIYFFPDSFENPFLVFLFALDILFIGISVYCILCVISQFQMYQHGILNLGRVGPTDNSRPIPTLRLQLDASQANPGAVVSYNGNGQRLTIPGGPWTSSTSFGRSNTDISSVSDEPTDSREASA